MCLKMIGYPLKNNFRLPKMYLWKTYTIKIFGKKLLELVFIIVCNISKTPILGLLQFLKNLLGITRSTNRKISVKSKGKQMFLARVLPLQV